ncbi:MAG TPA: CRTAC1 family protein [Pyrinomonadaceae bacterium]|nr:CRTAC1 family protein [Pyrinomonadaceae bacterium]
MRPALTALLLSAACTVVALPPVSARQAPAEGARAIEFTDVTGRAGIRWGVTRLAPGIKYLIETMGGGGGFLDYNNDGLLDIYLVNYTQPEPGSKTRDALYRNNGDGTFADVTEAAGINHLMWGMGLASGDYDNDGFADLYVTGYGSSRLYRNRGDGRFEDVTDKAGVNNKLWGAGAAFFDADADGRLDLFVCNYLDFDPDAAKVPCDFFEGRPYCYISKFKGSPGVLYRNNGDGRFEDVSAKSGIAAHRAKGLGVVALDYNNDGRMDIFQANDSDPNFLFRNEGNLKFSEVALEAECAFDPNGRVRGGMGVDAEDIDGDGFQDLFVTNFSQQTNAFWHNNGDGTFGETTYELGLGKVSLPVSGFGTRFLDYDNDGLTDLFVLNGHPFEPIQKVFPETTYAEPAFLFENTGKAFREVAAQRGAALRKSYLGRGLAVGDYDNDGDPDLLLMNAGEPPALLRNDGGNRNHWLGVELIGTRSNRDGTGALVTVRAGASRRSKQLLGGASYFSASDLRLLFGLGGAAKVDEVEVRWPSGALTRLKDVMPDRYVVVREDAAQPVRR